tara:strand:+ start:12755 stop:13123 length:369 start_codon:yes stop_codon:yes gene_type:complete
MKHCVPPLYGNLTILHQVSDPIFIVTGMVDSSRDEESYVAAEDEGGHAASEQNSHVPSKETASLDAMCDPRRHRSHWSEGFQSQQIERFVVALVLLKSIGTCLSGTLLACGKRSRDIRRRAY